MASPSSPSTSQQFSTIPTRPQRSLGRAFLIAIALTLGFFVLFLSLTMAAIGWYGYRQLKTFADHAQLDFPQIKQIVTTGLTEAVTADQGHTTFLILGIDSLASRGDAPPLTDTIILLTLDLDQATITALPLPRDIWSEKYQTKINALYAYGPLHTPDDPLRFPTTTIEALIGTPIHHTLVVSLEDVAQIIDLLGGVTVTVEQAFTDDQFPRPDVDVTTVTDPQQLYQTISFEAGPQVMSGSKALEYIRSRHSQGIEGDDLARSRRQLQVIQALMHQLRQPTQLTTMLRHPDRLGQLYALYHRQFAERLPITQVIALVRALRPNLSQLKLINQSLPIFPDNEAGVLAHPNNAAPYQQQWVYLIRNSDQFSLVVRQLLDLPNEAAPHNPTSLSLKP